MKKILISLLLVLSSTILFGQENQSVFSNMSFKNKQICNQLIPFWEKFTHMPESKYALLYHVLGLFDPHYSEDMENSVKKHGLLSANQKMNHGLRSVRQEIIYKDDPSLFNNALDREFDDVYFVPEAFYKSDNLEKYFAPSRFIRLLVKKMIIMFIMGCSGVVKKTDNKNIMIQRYF